MYLHIFRGDHHVEVYSSVVAKHLVRPPPNASYELDGTDAIVGDKDPINDSSAAESMHKLAGCGHLQGQGVTEECYLIREYIKQQMATFGLQLDVYSHWSPATNIMLVAETATFNNSCLPSPSPWLALSNSHNLHRRPTPAPRTAHSLHCNSLP